VRVCWGRPAVEKALKVALVLADSELPHTHDLELLVEQIKEAGTTVPDELSRTEWLTPWAAELRYDERIALDRKAALAAAENASLSVRGGDGHPGVYEGTVKLLQTTAPAASKKAPEPLN
jgi:HEPN domain-containing protein